MRNQHRALLIAAMTFFLVVPPGNANDNPETGKAAAAKYFAATKKTKAKTKSAPSENEASDAPTPATRKPASKKAAAVAAYQPPKLTSGAKMTRALEILLRSTSDLHQAFFKRNEKDIKAHLKNLIIDIDHTRSLAAMHTSDMHLKKILTTAERALLQVQSTRGDARLPHLKEAFRQLVLIARGYKFKEYKVFFCGKDTAVWLQTAATPQNPIDPKIGCGAKVE